MSPKGTAIVLENIRADFVHLIVLVVDGQQFLVAAHSEDELTNAYTLLCEISYLLVLKSTLFDIQSELAIPGKLAHLLVV